MGRIEMKLWGLLLGGALLLVFSWDCIRPWTGVSFHGKETYYGNTIKTATGKRSSQS